MIELPRADDRVEQLNKGQARVDDMVQERAG